MTTTNKGGKGNLSSGKGQSKPEVIVQQVATLDVAALAQLDTAALLAKLAELQKMAGERTAAEAAAKKTTIDAKFADRLAAAEAACKAADEVRAAVMAERAAEYKAAGIETAEKREKASSNGTGKGTKRGHGVKEIIKARLAETGGQTVDQLADYMWGHAHYAEKRAEAEAADKAAGIVNPNMGETGKLSQTIWSTVNWNLGRQEKDGVARGLDLKADDKGVYRLPAETAAAAA